MSRSDLSIYSHTTFRITSERMLTQNPVLLQMPLAFWRSQRHFGKL